MNVGVTQMDTIKHVQNDASATNARQKPAVPKKPEISTLENDIIRKRTHVRDMVRRLQEKELPNGNVKKPTFIKIPAKVNKLSDVPVKEEMGAETSNQTLEDLKAIDEDIEKLRKQIEERDKIISALREAAEAKDKKLDNLMMEYSKMQCNEKLDLDTSAEPNRATSSSPSSPPLCNGELCWTDSFVSKNYHEPVYAQLLNDHTALQRIYNELRTTLESKGKEFERFKKEAEVVTNIRTTDDGCKTETQENAINLIMAEQIKILKEREAQLISEAEELREQNDLMEFRILELEECRKEFLDKEVINEGKHRPEKLVWSERDLEDISDSGVMSLPTSEDLTSDSELGEAIRNYSPLGTVTNLGLLSPETGHSDTGVGDSKLKKSLKSTECLQESGIFEDAEVSTECAISTPAYAGSSFAKHSKACQTESVLDKTLLDIIDSSCDLFLSKNPGFLEEKLKDPKSDDLSTEISKLSVIQKRIQQKTSPPRPNSKSSHTVFTCPHSNSVIFYEERLAQLEDKLKIYESSGDTKDNLLAKRLQKEVDLAHKVKELSEKVSVLEISNKRLEEEKCEFEEAENDTRLQCQRLELKLQELIDKNAELKLEVERHRVMMSEGKKKDKKKDKNSFESIIKSFDNRIIKTDEKDIEARQRLSIIEAAMPALIAWNMFRVAQTPNVPQPMPTVRDDMLMEHKNDLVVETRNPDAFMLQKLEDLLNDQKKLRKEYEKVEETAADTERALRNRIEELEAKANRDREMLEEMTTSLRALRSEEKCLQNVGSVSSIRQDELDLFEELKQMVANEIQLRSEIDRLEKKEQAYMDSLEKADEIWASMEEDYKNRLRQAEVTSLELQQRISHLEATQIDLEKALAAQTAPDVDLSRTRHEVKSKIEELILENEKLKSDINRSLDKKFEEHKKFLEVENSSLKEELKKMQSEFVQEEKKLQLLEKELESAKKEVIQERRIGDMLRTELEDKNNRVTLMEVTLQTQISDLTFALGQKSKELSNLEVTVAELREEVETLENKVSDLVSALKQSKSTHDEGSPRNNNSHFPTPINGSVRQGSGSKSGGTKKASPKDDNKLIDEKILLNASNDTVLVKKESNLPYVRVLVPSKDYVRCIILVIPSLLRQDMQILIPHPLSVGIILMNKSHFAAETVKVWVNNRSDKEKLEPEIKRISIKNRELQLILEKLEEESKLKERELEELQFIARDILKEQKALESLYSTKSVRQMRTETYRMRKISEESVHPVTEQKLYEEGEEEGDEIWEDRRYREGGDEEGEEEEEEEEGVERGAEVDREGEDEELNDGDISKKAFCSEILYGEERQKENMFLKEKPRSTEDEQTIDPAVVKTIEEISASPSSLQVVLENLRDDSQSKKLGIKPLLERLGQSGDNLDFETVVQLAATYYTNNFNLDDYYGSDVSTFKITKESMKKTDSSEIETRDERSSAPKYLGRFSSASYPMLLTSAIPKLYFGSPINIDLNFNYVTQIKTVRRVGDDGVFLEWHIDERPSELVGFEIMVNGMPMHRVRSSSRNKALLHPLNLSNRILIQLFAMSQKGRSTRCSSTIFPDEHIIDRPY